MAADRYAVTDEQAAMLDQLRRDLRARRRRLGMSARLVGELVGVSYAHICAVETGRRPLSLPLLCAIAAALDVRLTVAVSASRPVVTVELPGVTR